MKAIIEIPRFDLEKSIKIPVLLAKNFGISFTISEVNRGLLEIKAKEIKESKNSITIKIETLNHKNSVKTISLNKNKLTLYQLVFVGWVFVSLDEYKNDYKTRAKEFFENAIKQEIDSCLPYYFLSDNNLVEYKNMEMADLYRALEKQDIFPNFYMLLWRKEKNKIRRDGIIRKGWQRFSHNLTLTAMYGRCLLDDNQYQECLKIIKFAQPFQGGISMRDYEELVYSAFMANIGLRKYDKAEKVIIQSNLDIEDKHFFVGWLLFYQKKYMRAENLFIKAVENALPKSSIAEVSLYYLLGCNQKNHNPEKIKEIMELIPENYNDFYTFPYGYFYHDFAEKTLRALLNEQLDELIKARVKGFLAYIIWQKYLSEIQNNREIVKKERQLAKEGLAFIKEAIRFYPDNSFFNIVFSKYYLFKKDYNNAILYSFRSLLNKKEDCLLYDDYQELDKCSEEFLEEYAEKLKIITDEMKIPLNEYTKQWFSDNIKFFFGKKKYKIICDLFLWVRQHQSLGEIKKQFQEEENLMGEYYNGAGIFEIAYSLNEIGNTDDAKMLYEYLIEKQGVTSSVLNNLAVIYEKKDDLLKARKLIKKAKVLIGKNKDEIIDKNYQRLIKYSKKLVNSKRLVKIKEKPILPQLTYNPETGIGLLRKKDFKLREQTSEFILFNEVFKRRGKKISRDEVVKIINIQFKHPEMNFGGIMSSLAEMKGNKETRRAPDTQVTATNEINEIIKNIRKKIGLNPKELVNNFGNITLTI